MTSKAEEAKEHIKKAEKCLKTTFLKWKPDVDSAIDAYNQAALCYRTARMHKESAEIYIKSGELQEQNGTLFHAAKAFEQAALLYKELKDFEKMAIYIGKAGRLFRESGSPDTASITLEKGAKALENSLPEKAAEFYLESVDASEVEEKWRQAAEQAGQAARMWVRLGRLDDAVNALKKKLSMYAHEGDNTAEVAGKAVTCLVVIHLARDDFVAAREIYQKAIGSNDFGRAEDSGPVGQLLKAFDTMDPDLGAEALKSAGFKYMENEYAKLARDLKIPGQSNKKGDSAKNSEQPVDADEEENEFDGGLC